MASPKSRLENPSISHHHVQISPSAKLSSDAAYPHGDRIRILRLPQVLDITGLGKTKIYQLQSEGNFPMRVPITDYSVGWIEQEVLDWLAKRVAIRKSRALNGCFRRSSGT
jgi:prophage regulatory protein